MLHNPQLQAKVTRRGFGSHFTGLPLSLLPPHSVFVLHAGCGYHPSIFIHSLQSIYRGGQQQADTDEMRVWEVG